MRGDEHPAGQGATRDRQRRNRGENGAFLTPPERMARDIAQTQTDGPPSMDVIQAENMLRHAESASSFLKALSHEGRLMILCHLSTGEKSVTELETLLSSRQAAVSQQLARLRLEGLVSYRREGKAIYYSLADEKARRLLELMHDMFCNARAPAQASAARPGD